MAVNADRRTLRVSHIPQNIEAKDLIDFFEFILGKGSIYACEIVTAHPDWKSRGFGRVQFETLDSMNTAISLSLQGRLLFNGSTNLLISNSFDDIVVRPAEPCNRQNSGSLFAGFMVADDALAVVETWEGVRAWIMPERKRVEFWLNVKEECYKMEIQFEDLMEVSRRCLDDERNPTAFLLKLKHGPKLYKRYTGHDLDLRFRADRYHICKENVEYLWVRTTDFSDLKAVGYSSSLCWETDEGSIDIDMFTGFPHYINDKKDLKLEDGAPFCAASETVPLLKVEPDSSLPYEVLFHLNSLVQAHKISPAAVSDNVISVLCSLSMDTATIILKKLHKKDVCYDLLAFIKAHLHVSRGNCKNHPSSASSRLTDSNVMSCHRVLITPTKVYCQGPEFDSSNWVVKHYAAYASDFLRVTFVDEDLSKLAANVVSTSIQRGIFAKPLKTAIYHRILTILKEGIVIGAKRFQFLAFSASQLRSNSVWMFASNDDVTAEDIRMWMGCFKKIRSVSKCAARMGQLFSSSVQTICVPVQDVEIIPDIETVSDGVGYCFSDGIGKISLPFARQVAKMCGLSHTPSAFQIRFGGYKGVVAVDRHSFRKLSLRKSMLKFESENRMLNVTKWSISMPCYLNREIVTLLSTLGIEDSVFEAMQYQQISLMDKMLTDRQVALNALESMSGVDSKNIQVKMLLHGYEPNVEPFLSMMLQAHRETQLSDLRTRCRIYVPKGRILVGCLDESGVLNYGQVFIRLTMTKLELQSVDQSFFKKFDDTTSILKGTVVVTKNPCLHPGDVRVLEAVCEVSLEEKDLIDCIVFPQKGERPHPNECSGGDLDGDLYFISWDQGLIPTHSEVPMDYTGRRPRLMDHDVTLEEIHKFFVDYMINDTLGTISTAHLIHSDRDPAKALSPKCLELAKLHSMAVDFAKTGAPAEMPRFLKPREFPDFMDRPEKPSYMSQGVLGKLFRATIRFRQHEKSNFVWSEELAGATYDCDLEVPGFLAFLEIAVTHKEMYSERMQTLFKFYGAQSEDEILTGNLRSRAAFLLRDNRRYFEVKDRISLSIKSLQKEAKGWFENSCTVDQRQMMASAWYHVTYHPDHQNGDNFLSFPWIVGDILLNIKSVNRRKTSRVEPMAEQMVPMDDMVDHMIY